MKNFDFQICKLKKFQYITHLKLEINELAHLKIYQFQSKIVHN